MRRSLWALVIGIPILTLLAVGFSHRPDTAASPLISRQASAFALRTLDHRSLTLASLRGHPVVLNFWASWCKECPVDHGVVQSVWRRYHNHGVAFVGVSYQDTESAARSFLAKYGGGWPTVADPDQQTAIDYGVWGVPETFLIDSAGIIRWKMTGTLSEVALGRQLDRLLRGRA